MLKWAIILAIVAIIAGALGFTGVAGAAAGIAKILFFVFLIGVVLMLVLGTTVFKAASNKDRRGGRVSHASPLHPV